MAAALAERFGAALDVTYRRREQSIGYKAGNIRDFCERWGALPSSSPSCSTPTAS